MVVAGGLLLIAGRLNDYLVELTLTMLATLSAGISSATTAMAAH